MFQNLFPLTFCCCCNYCLSLVPSPLWHLLLCVFMLCFHLLVSTAQKGSGRTCQESEMARSITMLPLCWRWQGVWIKVDARFPLPRGNHYLHQQNKAKGFSLHTYLHAWLEHLETGRLIPGLASHGHVSPRHTIHTYLCVCCHV